MTIWISAGEPSGDRWGGALASAMLKRDPTLVLTGMGGPAMRAVGLDCFDPPGHGIMGFAEPFRVAASLIGTYRRSVAAFLAQRPALIVVIDFPDFHMRLIERAAAAGIPCAYVIPPQVWAWRPDRGRRIAELCRCVVTAFDWERPWFAPYARPDAVRWLGHPLADSLPGEPPGAGEGPVALLPGSRRSEIMRLAPVMAEAIRLLGTSAVFVADHDASAGWMKEASRGTVPVRVGPAFAALREAKAAIVCAGTATLEAACAGIPSIVVFRTDPLTYRVARRLVHVPYAGLPNIVLGREAYPEFVQNALTADSLARALERVLSGPAETWRALGRSVRSTLGEPGVFDQIAGAVLATIDER